MIKEALPRHNRLSSDYAVMHMHSNVTFEKLRRWNNSLIIDSKFSLQLYSHCINLYYIEIFLSSCQKSYIQMRNFFEVKESYPIKFNTKLNFEMTYANSRIYHRRFQYLRIKTSYYWTILWKWFSFFKLIYKIIFQIFK